MGFFSNLFKSKKEKELEAIFNKINLILNSDEEQNKLLPKALEKICDPSLTNTIPGAIGDFGRTITNPIPVNGPLGEITYLSRLLIQETGEKLFFHRLGSCNDHIDVYEMISISGNYYDVLYLDMYYLHKSRLVPKGYILQDEVTTIRGINSFSSNFPVNFKDVLMAQTEKVIGYPCIDTDAKNIDIKRALYTISLYKNED